MRSRGDHDMMDTGLDAKASRNSIHDINPSPFYWIDQIEGVHVIQKIRFCFKIVDERACQHG